MGIDFTQLLVGFAIIIVSLTVHEAAHAWSAERLGDPTARLLGRVSLNPAVHVDPIGTLLFPLIAMATGAPLLGWAKPVPVNVHHLRGDWKRKFMLIAAAGPASNLLLATLLAVVLRAGLGSGSIGLVLQQGIATNVLLAVFNMIPLPPLDGGNVMAGLLRGRVAEAFDRLRPYGFLILYALLFSGTLDTLIMPPARVIWSVLVA